MPAAPPAVSTASGERAMVCTIDRLATEAALGLIDRGGSAVDAAIGANAVLGVTSPHLCGMGGDLFALVHEGDAPPAVLNASGRAGSGADPDRLRAEGHRRMPFTGDVRSAPVPGCVDGWVALHGRYGSLPLGDVLAPAVAIATDGFAASPLLAMALLLLEGMEGCDELARVRPEAGERVVRPQLAATLAAVAESGRDAFYGGQFGEALVAVGGGEYHEDDLAARQADWVEPLGRRLWGHDVWTVPPNSQGFLTLATARIAELVGIGPDGPDPDEPAWVHALVEAAVLAGWDRPARLHAGADGEALLDDGDLVERASWFDPNRAWVPPMPATADAGDTTYLCVVAPGPRGRERLGVSLIQSNAAGFGCHVAVPGTGVLLHNRGVGFCLEPGHPAEYGPGRRPPHTLSPALVTHGDGSLRAVLGTMGGDSQPQIVAQLLARLLAAGEAPAAAIGASRGLLDRPGVRGFDLWDEPPNRVRIEAHASARWAEGLRQRGHIVDEVAGQGHAFGHAHLIDVGDDGRLTGAADPRAETELAAAR